jgi:hypothetical protein
MAEPGNKLTVRIRMAPAEKPASGMPVGHRYRWGRIAAAAAGLALLGWGLSVLLLPDTDREPDVPPSAAIEPPPAMPTAPLEVEDSPVTSPGPTATSQAAGAGDRSLAPPAIEAEGEVAVSDAAATTVAPAPEATASDPVIAEPAPSTLRPDAVTDAAPGSKEPLPAASVLVPGDTRILSDKVARFLLSKGMRGSEPLGRLEDIKIDDPASGTLGVFAFSDVRGMAGETLVYRWLQGERVVARVRVGVGSDKWRSHSSKVINGRMRGPWRVELTTGDGTLLAFAEFAY